MNKIILGTVCGLAFGIIDVLIMIPLKYENNRKKAEAMLAVFDWFFDSECRAWYPPSHCWTCAWSWLKFSISNYHKSLRADYRHGNSWECDYWFYC